MSERKLCPHCVAAKLTSRLYHRGSGSTLMGGGETFYDEQGVQHRHDPNTLTTVWECSNGHKWQEKTHHKCPSCEYPDPLKKYDSPDCMCNYPSPCPNQDPSLR